MVHECGQIDENVPRIICAWLSESIDGFNPRMMQYINAQSLQATTANALSAMTFS